MTDTLTREATARALTLHAAAATRRARALASTGQPSGEVYGAMAEATATAREAQAAAAPLGGHVVTLTHRPELVLGELVTLTTARCTCDPTRSLCDYREGDMNFAELWAVKHPLGQLA